MLNGNFNNFTEMQKIPNTYTINNKSFDFLQQSCDVYK